MTIIYKIIIRNIHVVGGKSQMNMRQRVHMIMLWWEEGIWVVEGGGKAVLLSTLHLSAVVWVLYN